MANLLHALSAVAAVSALEAAGALRTHTQPDPLVELSLSSIRELRVLDLEAAGPAQEDDMFMVMGGEEPGLALEWRIGLPAGSTLVEVGGLRDLKASDSAGGDLAPEDLEYALTAEPRYDFGDFGEEPREILDSVTLTLGLPSRSAETFSLTAEADATVSTGTEEIKVALTDQWQTLAADKFGGEAVRVRLNHDMGGAIGVEFAPAAAAERAIESMLLNFEGDELENSGSMSDYSTITYYFDGALEKGDPANLTLTVRTGLETVAIRFELKDQKLP